ncbi:hypothetical protein TRFO_02766 [Tritrichomonas foetus]|uniref:Initiator binding domain-containing protein n=1 Tax=Tritrichomonas foetus TaxID=1144522 RepID=A0A1J4L3J0_9EUKA|nr:hypothetical protein TRFO_02766 [Tritrichomonas foetus]|eukprot:OHT16485.1 hypothetical protein TRFO_02766 [Tritrichomonas foetus]
MDPNQEAPSPNHKDYKPKHYNLLSESDKHLYTHLRSTLSSHICRNRRGKRIETFAEMLATIQNFCIRGDGDDWRRCLVCGIVWLQNGVAVNTRQLGLLIDKCKSSINGSLQKMGYNTLPNRSDSSEALIEVIPQLRNSFSEVREWTVRLFSAATPQPNLPNFHVHTNHAFASPAPHHSGNTSNNFTDFSNFSNTINLNNNISNTMNNNYNPNINNNPNNPNNFCNNCNILSMNQNDLSLNQNDSCMSPDIKVNSNNGFMNNSFNVCNNCGNNFNNVSYCNNCNNVMNNFCNTCNTNNFVNNNQNNSSMLNTMNNNNFCNFCGNNYNNYSTQPNNNTNSPMTLQNGFINNQNLSSPVYANGINPANFGIDSNPVIMNNPILSTNDINKESSLNEFVSQEISYSNTDTSNSQSNDSGNEKANDHKNDEFFEDPFCLAPSFLVDADGNEIEDPFETFDF